MHSDSPLKRKLVVRFKRTIQQLVLTVRHINNRRQSTLPNFDVNLGQVLLPAPLEHIVNDYISPKYAPPYTRTESSSFTDGDGSSVDSAYFDTTSASSLTTMDQGQHELSVEQSRGSPDDAGTSSAVYVEPEVPDPFLIDDEHLSDKEDDRQEYSQSESQQTITKTSLKVSISSPPSSTFPVSSGLRTAFNLNKDVPPPPTDSSETEEDAPEMYLPSLVMPTMFLPIPNNDPLTSLLNKYIPNPEKRPARDLSGNWHNSNFHKMVMGNNWRTLATMARDRIVNTDPEDLALVLGLWYLRLACLARLRLFNQTAAECTNLFTTLNSLDPPETRAWLFDRLVPFELEVMYARLKYWAGDHMAYFDALHELLQKCKVKSRAAGTDEQTVAMWKERGARICLIIASQMIEAKDYKTAANFLEPLCYQEQHGITSSTLHSAIGRIYLQGGYLRMAAKHFSIVAEDSAAPSSTKNMNEALLSSAEGDWERTSQILKDMLDEDPSNYAAANNLSVSLLSEGKLKEGIDVLEKALRHSPSSVVVAEPFLFNLSTLYELRSANAAEKKRDLLIEVAKWSGDGLKTACLKMPTS